MQSETLFSYHYDQYSGTNHVRQDYSQLNSSPAMALFTLSVSAHVERRSILALIVISFGTVEKRTDKTISRCFTIVTDASFHPISCGMATSRNRPRR